MLMIREEQMEVLSQYMRDGFVERMIVHLRKAFSNETSNLDDKTLHGIINYGISNAEKYQIYRECDTERYLDLMFFLSFDFDTNPQTSWANNILQKDWDAETKMDVLYAKYEAKYEANYKKE